MANPRILAIIPARNVARRIGGVIAALRAYGWDVAAVDDCSSDDTAAVAAAAGATVLRLPFNLGYGGALQTGYLYARACDYAAVVQLDGDGQHDPVCAPALLEPILSGEADLVLGSRFRGDSCRYRVPWARRLGQKLFGALAGLLTGRPVTDPTSGYQALAPRTVRLYCTRLFPDDFPDADMWVLLHRLGLRVVERPAIMHAAEGASMHSGVLRPLYYVAKLGLAMFIACFRDLPAEDGP